MSGNHSRLKGYRFENELRLDLIESGFEAYRVPLSGAGREKDDLVFTCGWGEQSRIEAKIRASLPAYLVQPLEKCDAVVFRENRGKTFVLITWERFKELCQ